MLTMVLPLSLSLSLYTHTCFKNNGYLDHHKYPLPVNGKQFFSFEKGTGMDITRSIAGLDFIGALEMTRIDPMPMTYWVHEVIHLNPH